MTQDSSSIVELKEISFFGDVLKLAVSVSLRLEMLSERRAVHVWDAGGSVGSLSESERTGGELDRTGMSVVGKLSEPDSQLTS